MTQSQLPANVSLPAELVANILRLLQASSADDQHWPMVDCGLRSSKMTLDFTFDSITIRIPMSALINPPVAELGIVPDTYANPILGGPFSQERLCCVQHGR